MMMRANTAMIAGLALTLFHCSTASANGERHTGIQLRVGCVSTWSSKVTTFALTGRASSDSVASSSIATPKVEFTVAVREGDTRAFCGGSGEIHFANPGKDTAALRALQVNVLVLEKRKGWVSVAQGVVGDALVFRCPLPRKQGGVPIHLWLADLAGNRFSSWALPALAGRSKASYKLSGWADWTGQEMLGDTRYRIELTAAFSIQAREGRVFDRRACSSEWIAEMKVTVDGPAPVRQRVNGRVLLSAWVSGKPNSEVASTGILKGGCTTGGAGFAPVELAPDGCIWTRDIIATGKAGTTTLLALGSPVRFAAGKCGATEIALTAALAGNGGSPDGLETLTGNPTVTSCALVAQNCPSEEPKDDPQDGAAIAAGDFRTQTQGGWGAEAHGGNVGALRDAHFSTVFPAGLSIGSRFQLLLTSAAAVERFLPQGGTAGVLTANQMDPDSTPAGVLAGQLVAATLNASFSAAGLFGQKDPMPLGSLVIAEGPFAGTTVSGLLELANQAIGGGDAQVSISDLNDALTRINECFVDGEVSSGFLRRP